MRLSPQELLLFRGEHGHGRIVLAIAVQSDASVKRLHVVLVLFVAVSASAQSSFEIGPRVSNYSTDLISGLIRLDTGRVSSYGLVGGYRTGSLVIDWLYEHDPQNGISPTAIVLAVDDYERDRGELTLGFRITPSIDLQGGVRLDQIRVGGVSFLGSSFASDLDVDHQALVAGVKFHTATSGPASFYILGRGIVGDAKFNDISAGEDHHGTTGYRAEAGIPIRLGQSNWSIVPGAEYEQWRADDVSFRLKTNRVFLNFVYSSRP